uniref:Tyr recombinase domain-containing protein n=1 Tax=Amphimedon queenslandica TaxID=400682 RepID=A0A1X7VS99_AMPQE
MRRNENRLFISFIKQHNAVTSSSIARWLRTTLEEAGIDSVFGAHSIRGASASAAARGGVTLREILEAASW